jgi:hypothetical protein
VAIKDSADWVSVTAKWPTAAEVDQETGVFTFTRAGSLEMPLRVNFTVSGTATPGSTADYTLSGSGSHVDIPAGQMSTDVTLTPNVDTTLEGHETAVVTLAAGLYAIGIPHTATVTIADAAPTIDSLDPNAAEQGSDAATFRITRHGPTTYEWIANVVFTGTATIDSDYSVEGTAVVGASGNVRHVRIPAGEKSATVMIVPTDDTEVEDAESVIAGVEGTVAAAMIAANDSSSLRLTLLDTYAVGVNQTAILQVAREQPAPSGGITVTVTSDVPAS